MSWGRERGVRRGVWVLGWGCATAAVVASVVYAVVKVHHGGLGPADVVTVLGFPLAVAGGAVMLAGLRKPCDGTDADLALGQARTLARRVAADEGEALTQLLGNDTARINLRYTLAPGPSRAAVAPPAGQAVADAAVPLPDVAAYYRTVNPGRLVITGAPGAGKTVLALQLLLALVQSRADADPVPIRVPLAQWDTDVPLREVLVRRLGEAFRLPRTVAGNLAAHGLLLPVLDGLDEMDPPLPNGDPDPAAPRARAALDRLSAYQDAGSAAPLVLVCRTANYEALATADLLLDAARIEIAPVGSSPAVAYLRARARDLPRWQPLLDHLTTQPASVHAQLLSTPWRLGLTATDYHTSGAPAELLTRTTADTLDDHLLARYITAVTTAAADGNPNRYTPRQIHRWLHELAVHLAPTPWTPRRTDIALQSVWPLAGRMRVRTADALLSVLSFLPMITLTWAGPFDSLYWGVIALLVGVVHGRGGDEATALRLDFHRVTPAVRYLLIGALLVAISAGWVAIVDGHAVTAGVIALIVVGLTFGPLSALVGEKTSVRPAAVIREDAQAVVLLGTLTGLSVAMMATSGSGMRTGLLIGLEVGQTFVLLGLAWISLSIRLLGRLEPVREGLRNLPPSSASWRYFVFLLCARGRVPFRLVRFLDWCCDAGLMRYSGPAYQFRHRELQDWLVAHPIP